MPLPDGFLEASTKLDKQEDYTNPEPFPPDNPLNVGSENLDDALNVPKNALIRKKTFITTAWTTVPEPVMENTGTGCILYKVGFQCTETTSEFLIIGTLEIPVRSREVWYSLFKYIYHCPGQVPQITPWTEDVALSIDPDSNLSIGAEGLVLKMEGILQYPPQITPGNSQDPAPGSDIPFVKPPEMYGRPFSEHGYNDRITEGDFIVLRETVWLLQYPVQVKDCMMAAHYRAAVLTRKWFREGKNPVPGFPQTEILEPPIRLQRIFKIPGCESRGR